MLRNRYQTHFTRRPFGRLVGGFTLVELLVVIAIIGILSVIGLSSFRNASRTSRDGKRKGDLSQVRAALELYKAQQNTYPVHGPQSQNAYTAAVGDMVTAGYLSQPVPTDPKNTGSYVYTYNSAGNTFCVCALLETVGSGNSTGSCAGSSGDYYCAIQP